MTTYQIVTGRIPFEEERRDDVVKEWIKDGERPDRKYGIPERLWMEDWLWELLERCWHHDPETRPEFNEIITVLEDGFSSWQ